MKKTQRRKRSNGKRKPYLKMNTDELAAATAEFDREDLSPPVALRGEKLRRYRRAMAKRGRPAIGAGSKPITVTLERGLLSRADRMARRWGISRSQLIARALEVQIEKGA